MRATRDRAARPGRPRLRVVAAASCAAILVFAACGSDDDGGGDGDGPQAELAALLLEDATPGVDSDCISDKTADLSDEDAQFLIDNIESDAEDFDEDLQAWVDELFECFSGAVSEEG